MIFDWSLVDYGRVLKIRFLKKEFRYVIPMIKRRVVWRLLRHFEFCQAPKERIQFLSGRYERYKNGYLRKL